MLVDVTLVDVDEPSVWRIGHEPDPAAWTPRRFAFGQRWDDPTKTFRTGYWSQTLLAALVELLAGLRPAPLQGLESIVEDPEDVTNHPARAAGAVSESWLEGRMLARARLTGQFCDVTTARTLAALHPLLVEAARRRGLADFDAAAITQSADRSFTQLIAGWLYGLANDDEEPQVDGIQYRSRHGGDLMLWAVFEQPGEAEQSTHLSAVDLVPLEADSPDVQQAFALLGLEWV